MDWRRLWVYYQLQIATVLINMTTIDPVIITNNYSLLLLERLFFAVLNGNDSVIYHSPSIVNRENGRGQVEDLLSHTTLSREQVQMPFRRGHQAILLQYYFISTEISKFVQVIYVSYIREIKIHVYRKRQTSDSSWEFLRIENKQT